VSFVLTDRLAGLEVPVPDADPVGGLDVQPVVAVPGPPLHDALAHVVIVGARHGALE